MDPRALNNGVERHAPLDLGLADVELWLGLYEHESHLEPLLLAVGEQEVLAQLLLLPVILRDDDADEQVEYEERAHYHVKYEEDRQNLPIVRVH